MMNLRYRKDYPQRLVDRHDRDNKYNSRDNRNSSPRKHHSPRHSNYRNEKDKEWGWKREEDDFFKTGERHYNTRQFSRHNQYQNY